MSKSLSDMNADELLEAVHMLRGKLGDQGVLAQRIVVNPTDWPRFEAILQAFMVARGHPLAPDNTMQVFPQLIGMPVLVTDEIDPGVVHMGPWRPHEQGTGEEDET